MWESAINSAFMSWNEICSFFLDNSEMMFNLYQMTYLFAFVDALVTAKSSIDSRFLWH